MSDVCGYFAVTLCTATGSLLYTKCTGEREIHACDSVLLYTVSILLSDVTISIKFGGLGCLSVRPKMWCCKRINVLLWIYYVKNEIWSYQMNYCTLKCWNFTDRFAFHHYVERHFFCCRECMESWSLFFHQRVIRILRVKNMYVLLSQAIKSCTLSKE